MAMQDHIQPMGGPADPWENHARSGVRAFAHSPGPIAADWPIRPDFDIHALRPLRSVGLGLVIGEPNKGKAFNLGGCTFRVQVLKKRVLAPNHINQ